MCLVEGFGTADVVGSGVWTLGHRRRARHRPLPFFSLLLRQGSAICAAYANIYSCLLPGSRISTSQLSAIFTDGGREEVTRIALSSLHAVTSHGGRIRLQVVARFTSRKVAMLLGKHPSHCWLDPCHYYSRNRDHVSLTVIFTSILRSHLVARPVSYTHLTLPTKRIV